MTERWLWPSLTTESQMPLAAALELTKNPKIDLLVTIQHSLHRGTCLNI